MSRKVALADSTAVGGNHEYVCNESWAKEGRGNFCKRHSSSAVHVHRRAMVIAVEHGLQWEYAMMLSQESRNELTGPELCSSSCHLEKTNTFLWFGAK